MRMITKKNTISIILIILGILIFLFPFIDRAYSWYWQNKTMKSFEQLNTVFAEEQIDIQELKKEVIKSNQQESKVINSEETEEQKQTIIAKKNNVQPIGIIKIHKINLKLPIFEGATQKNMKIGVGWLKETTKLGEVGNTALAAHRSYTYGRFFNRLDEVDIGDEIVITTNGFEYRYKVFKKVVVEPTDTSVLARNKKDKIITLITCTPIKVATHRLIIQAKIIN